MAASIHNIRIWRFFLVTGIVALLIFVYATYSSIITGTPSHMRASSLVAPGSDFEFERLLYAQSLMLNNSKEINALKDNRLSAVPVKNVSFNAVNPHKQPQQQSSHNNKHQHRPPTIDIDAIGDDGNNNLIVADVGTPAVDSIIEDSVLGLMSSNLLEEQYLQAVDNGNLSSSQLSQLPTSKVHNTDVIQVIENNKIPESDVLIPIPSLQKFIENADKVLNNISLASPQVETKVKKDNELVMQNASKDPVVPVANKEVLKKPTKVSVVKTVSVNKGPIKPDVDTRTGVTTHELYEAGHKNEEIAIDKICPNNGKDLRLLILIMSAPGHNEARLAIRQTWGHFGMRRDVATAFVLGRTLNETMNQVLTEENFVYGDLIRGNFIDSYNNLTLKTLSSLEWVDKYCSQTKYLLKTDDDMFINVPKLLTFLNSHAKDKRVIFGRLAKKWKPIRNKKSKYYVSVGQFSSTIYPPFTTGPAYVLTTDIVHELFERAMQQLYLKLEDVYTTGVIAQQLGIRRVHVNEFLNRRIAFNACNIRKTISVHMIKSNEQYDLWKKLLDQSTKCK